jgi:hypothetical protein
LYTANEGNLLAQNSNISDTLSEKGGFTKSEGNHSKPKTKLMKLSTFTAKPLDRENSQSFMLRNLGASSKDKGFGNRNLRKILSPSKRLSHISEKSADDIPHNAEASNIKMAALRRSSSVGNKIRVSSS